MKNQISSSPVLACTDALTLTRISNLASIMGTSPEKVIALALRQWMDSEGEDLLHCKRLAEKRKTSVPTSPASAASATQVPVSISSAPGFAACVISSPRVPNLGKRKRFATASL